MALKEILERTRTASEAKRSPQVVVQLRRAINELRASGALERIVKVGEPMPHFALPGQSGIVDSAVLLAQGPLVVTFYRGKW